MSRPLDRRYPLVIMVLMLIFAIAPSGGAPVLAQDSPFSQGQMESPAPPLLPDAPGMMQQREDGTVVFWPSVAAEATEQSTPDACALPPPVLKYPKGGTTVHTLIPPLEFSRTTDMYLVQMSTSSSFSPLTYNMLWGIGSMPNPSLDIGHNLQRNTTYYWRVATRCEDGTYGAFSTPAMFRTGDVTGPFVGPPTMIAPASEAVLSSMEVFFLWGNVGAANGWQLRVYNSLSVAQNDTTSKTPPWGAAWNPDSWYNSTQWEFSAGGTYYWRVAANTAAGYGPLSPVRTFTVPSPTSTVTGRVTDPYGAGISEVEISDGVHKTRTGSDGRYWLTGLGAGSHTIQVSKERFAFSPSSRLVSVPPNQSDVNFQGRLTSLAGQVTTGHSEALPNVFVGLLIPGQGYYAATTHTDEIGRYAFGSIPQASSYQLRVILRDQAMLNRVHWGNNGLLVSATTPWLPVSSLQSGAKDISFTDSTLTSDPIPQEELDDLATMYYHTRQVQSFVRNGLGMPEIAPPDMVWGFEAIGTSVYYSSDRIIHIGADSSDRSYGGRPMNREWHEDFHHLMNMTLGLKRCPTCDNHGGTKNPDTSDSWTEGWAEFWPCALWDYLGYAKPELYRWAGTPVSFEQNWEVWDSQGSFLSSVSREEFAVASLLWDLYDGKQSADSDNVDLSRAALWNAIGHTTPGNNLETMRDVYTKLQVASLKNEDGTEVTGEDLDQIFIAHGFFADSNGDQNRDSDEAVGWGGMTGRAHALEVPGAYIKVKMQNEDGAPLTGGSVRVTIRYENSYYDYEAEVPLGNGADNLVYLELPPLGLAATATISAENGGGFSESIDIGNDQYWENVQTSTTGYALEHTFTVRYQLHLPILLK